MNYTSWYDNYMDNLYANLFPDTTTMNSGNDGLTKSRSNDARENLTFPDTISYSTAIGLYHNTIPGYKLGAYLCYAIITIPLSFQGVPHFDLDSWEGLPNEDFWQDKFKFYNEKRINYKRQIQAVCHIAGTIGIFPWFDFNAGFVRWNFIKPDTISAVLTDIKTKQLAGIITTIEYTWIDEEGKEYIFTEVKRYTKKKITTIRTGTYPSFIQGSEIRRNPTGTLPIFFTNDRDPDAFEGHSEFERVLSVIKAYSEVNLAAHEAVMNIKPKLIQEVSDKTGLEAWKVNNGFGAASSAEISIEDTDFIINLKDKESTEVIVPQNLVENHLSVLNLDFWAVVQGTGIPEMAFGLQMVGNAASPQTQMSTFLSFVGGKQTQETNPYGELADVTMQLEAIAYNQVKPDNIVIKWNELDSLTEVERAEVWKAYCEGIQKLSDSSAVDLESIHLLLKTLTKGEITEDFDEFKKKIEEYGSLKSMLMQEYGGMNDFKDTDNPVKPADELEGDEDE